MLELCRTVRFCLSDGSTSGGGGSTGATVPLATPRDNAFSAWPAMRGLGRYYELHVCCRGEADPTTGYFINIRHIDEAVREHVLPDLEQWIAGGRQDPYDAPMGELMRRIATLLDPPLGDRLASVTLQLTPMLSLTLWSHAMDRILIRQQYEFSAAHRLHVDALSEQENREIFGKCNNPAGHGHNYRVEVCISAPMDPVGRVVTPEELDAVVHHRVIQHLDHKHLNLDVPRFRELNPSVENISKVIWEMLSPHLDDLGPAAGAALDAISVWETGKTVCTYRGPRVAAAS